MLIMNEKIGNLSSTKKLQNNELLRNSRTKNQNTWNEKFNGYA